MHPLLSGTVALPIEEGARFDAGRYLSSFAARLEKSGASVRRHAATMTFENLRLWNARRALAWCSGTGEVVEGDAGPVLRFSLRFAESALVFAVGAGVAMSFYLWRYQNWAVLRCLVPAVIIGFLAHAIDALVLLMWFRWTARQTARAVTYRPPELSSGQRGSRTEESGA